MLRRTCVLLSVVLCVAAYDYKTLFYKQKVDHFSFSNDDYFLQRYLIADQYWNETRGPLFFYTGNEGDITMFANNSGFIWELASKYQALLIFAEHRYYGISLPYGNASFSTKEKMGYLTSEQALADYASLIHDYRSRHSKRLTSAIAFGGSYGGMLAAWMRMKYPHIIQGALASSAPIFQFPNLCNCSKFSEIVTKDFDDAGSECVKSIRESWKIFRTWGSTADGRMRLSFIFKLCDQLSTENFENFIDWISGTWEYLAMVNYPYPTTFLTPLPAYPIKETCKYLTNSNESDPLLLYHLFKAVSVFQNYSGTVTCFDIYQDGGKSLGTEKWEYQSCTEMVMPMCQNGITDMFEPSPWNFTAFSKSCQENWNVTPDPDKAIIMYGGKNITASSNIFFSNGKLDPWYSGGVLKSMSESLIAYFIKDAAHHLDLRASNPADPESVIQARLLEMHWIETWMKSWKNYE